MSDTYYQKYLKYKNKYLSLKAEVEGGASVRTPLIEEALVKVINMIIELKDGRGTRDSFINDSLDIFVDLKSIEFTSKITKGTQKKSTHTSIADKNYIAVGIFTGKLIEKGKKIWLDNDNNIILGWRGSYSPPTVNLRLYF